MVNKYCRPKLPSEYNLWIEDRKKNLELMAGRKLSYIEVWKIIAQSNARLKVNEKMMQKLARKKTI